MDEALIFNLLYLYYMAQLFLIFLLILSPPPAVVMSPKVSKKQDPDISQQDVESEIAQLAGETSGTSRPAQPTEAETWQAIRSMFSDFLKEQDLRQAQLVSGLSASASQTQKEVLAAIADAISCPPPQQAPTGAACSSQPEGSFAKQNLFSPSLENEVEGDWEVVEGDEASSGDEDDDFEGWEFAPSGKASVPVTSQPVQQSSALSAPNEQASTSASPVVPPASSVPPATAVPAPQVELDDELFNVYGLPVNWKPASELVAWLQQICNKEVPFSVLKEVNEAFVPKEDLQPLFVAPALPQAVNRKLYTAPKSQSRVPKLVNSSLLRAQKELCVSYKPLIEVLNFFYSEAFVFLSDSVPELRAELARLKLLLSQGLAIVMSAGLKVSRARKHALRPLLKYPSSGILEQPPTSEHVLGSSDLASLSEKASKEYKALSGVFRQNSQYRSRFRTNLRYSRNYRGYGFKYNQYSQNQASASRFPRSRSRNRRPRASTTTNTSAK